MVNIESWKEKVLQMYKNGNTRTEMSEAIKKDFPELDDHKRREKVKSFLRSTDEYKQNNSKTAGTTGFTKTVKKNADGTEFHDSIITLLDGENATETEILKAHKLNPDLWTITSYSNTFWGNGDHKQYRSKITVKPKQIDDLTPEEIAKFFEDIKSPVVKRMKPKKGRCALVVNIADLHLGKLCWNGETGENYDYKIAEKRFFGAVDDIIANADWGNIDKIFFPIGNDFFNFDSPQGNTTSGTPQNNDLRWQKMFKKGKDMLIKAIEELAEFAPVEALYVPGNHDMTTSFYVVEALNAYFRNNENITVDVEAKTRKYRQYGATFIGFTHGDTDAKRLHLLMPAEARELWGQTKYHEFLTGHLHKESIHTDEIGNVIIRRTSSMVGTDAWHYQQGYVGSVKKTQHFIYDFEKGLVDIHNTVVEE